MRLPGHGGMVVVAPIGTKPLLGGSLSTVPAGTLSGLRILFNSTRAGADKLNFSAMEYNESPDCTVYSRTATKAVVVLCATVVVVADGDESPDPFPVKRPDKIAKAANTQVLHNKYIWRRVRKNISAMLEERSGARMVGQSSTLGSPMRTFAVVCRNLEGR